MKQIYMHEVTYLDPDKKPTEGFQALTVIYVSDKEEVEIFKASEMAQKVLNEGANFQHRVIYTGYMMSGEEKK